MFLHDRRRAQRHIYWLFNSFAGVSFWPLVCPTGGNVLLPTSMLKSCRSESALQRLNWFTSRLRTIKFPGLNWNIITHLRCGQENEGSSSCPGQHDVLVRFKERGCKHVFTDVCGKMTLSSDLCEQFPAQFWDQSLISGHIEENMKPVPWSDSGFHKRRSPRDQWGTSQWWCPPLTGLLAATISFSYILMLNQTSAHSLWMFAGDDLIG